MQEELQRGDVPAIITFIYSDKQEQTSEMGYEKDRDRD